MEAFVPVGSLVRKAGQAPDAGDVADIASYDWIAVSSSGGKDSQAMLDYVTELALAAGVADRIVVIHADLGRVEWEGTGELAHAQAKHYGHRFELVSRIGREATVSGKTYKAGEKFGDLLDYAERRGAWPDNKNRWCTSEFKRGPILTVYTALAKEWREKTGEKRPCRILDCMGLRALESAARSKKVQIVERKKSRTQHVVSWLPILRWTEEQVWERIEASGVPYHRAYDLGMPRLSCAFCIFAPKAALVLAGKHNRELLDAYVAVEAKIDHRFRMDISLAEVRTAVEANEAIAEMNGTWNM